MKHAFKVLLVLILLTPLETVKALSITPCVAEGPCPKTAISVTSTITTPTSSQASQTTPSTQANSDVLLSRIQALESKISRLEKLLDTLGTILGVKNLSALTK